MPTGREVRQTTEGGIIGGIVGSVLDNMNR
jgi:hypothetical protein